MKKLSTVSQVIQALEADDWSDFWQKAEQYVSRLKAEASWPRHLARAVGIYGIEERGLRGFEQDEIGPIKKALAAKDYKDFFNRLGHFANTLRLVQSKMTEPSRVLKETLFWMKYLRELCEKRLYLGEYAELTGKLEAFLRSKHIRNYEFWPRGDSMRVYFILEGFKSSISFHKDGRVEVYMDSYPTLKENVIEQGKNLEQVWQKFMKKFQRFLLLKQEREQKRKQVKK